MGVVQRARSGSGVEAEVKPYPEAGRRSLNGSVPPPLACAPGRLAVLGYRHEESEDAWRRILAFVRDHLGVRVRS